VGITCGGGGGQKRALERGGDEGEMEIIMKKAIYFAIVGPTTNFKFERCRLQSC
jgi:hypothetical protein